MSLDPSRQPLSSANVICGSIRDYETRHDSAWEHLKSGEYGKASELYRENFVWARTALGNEDPITVHDQDMLAQCLYGLGSYQEAADNFQSVLEIRTKKPGHEVLELVLTQHHLALSLSKLGRYGEAADLDEKTLKARQSILGLEHKDTLWSRYSLARTLCSLGRYREAADLDEKTLKARESILGLEHKDTLWSRYSLAIRLHALGRFDEAAKHDRQTVASRQKSLCQDDQPLIDVKHNLARNLHALGCYDEAADLLQEIGEILRKTRAEDDPYIVEYEEFLTDVTDAIDQQRAAGRRERREDEHTAGSGNLESQNPTREDSRATRGTINNTRGYFPSNDVDPREDNRATSAPLPRVNPNPGMRAGDCSLGQGYKETTSKKKRSGTNLGDERLRCDNAEPRANSSAPALNGSISDIEALEKPKHQEHVSRHSRSKRGRNYTGTLDDSGEDGMNKSTPVSRNNSNTDAGVRENRSKEEHRSRKNSMDNLALPSPRIQDATPRANSESIPQTSMVETDGLVGGLVAQSMLGTSNGAHFEDRSHEDPKQRRKPTNSPMLQKAINSHAVLCDTRGCTGYLYSSEATAADKWFEMLNSITQELLNKHRKENTKGRVKIAILDTGIDRNHPDYRRRWKGRIRNTRSWIGDSAYEDSCGHGTHSAGLLMSIAPEARLYIARVAKDFRGADADSVAQAIVHAVDEWNVDIISMSFGFKSWHNSIEKAINKASSKKVLMFAAASNDGARQGIAFPASATLKVMCINSADGNGAASKYNPPLLDHGLNFSALGEDVLSAWPSALDAKSEMRRSGTSTSTPIAAAVAALILEFASIVDNLPMGSDVKIIHRARLKTLEGMREVLTEMSIQKNGYRFIVPWKVLKNDIRRVADRLSEILENKFGEEDVSHLQNRE